MACGGKPNTTNKKVISVETDAVPVNSDEDDQTIPQDDDHLLDNNVFSKARTQQEAAASAHTEATSQSHGNTFDKFLPQHLREDYNIDLLLIHSEADYGDAKAFQEFVQKKVKFCKHVTPNVALYGDVLTDFPIFQLDQVFQRSIYILLYVTTNFCMNFSKLSDSLACLERTLEKPEERKAIILVHTCSEEIRKFQLPMKIKYLQALNYYDETSFTENVIKLLENKSNLILIRNHQLEQERQEYFKENRDKLNLMQSEFEKLTVSHSGTKKAEKSARDKPSESPAEGRVKDADLRQQRQLSVSSKQKPVVSSGDIETEEDVPKCRRNPQQKDQQRNRKSDTSLAKDMAGNESGYNSYAAEEPTRMNYSSLPESAGDMAEPTNLP